MWVRIATSVVGLPLILFILIHGGLVLRAALGVVAVLGMNELYCAVTGRRSPWLFVAILAAGIYFIQLPELTQTHGTAFAMPAAAVMACGVLVCVFYKHFRIPRDMRLGTSHTSNAMLAIICFVYVTYMLSFVFLVRDFGGGGFYVWLIFIAAWGADTCAYFTGKTLGRRKLCPTLSPSKTVEGAVGGVLGAAILAVLYTLVMSGRFGWDASAQTLFTYAAVTAVAAVLSIFGDLTASAVKRRANVKDYGSIFPGHGGVLDRFDSVLFTAPAIYILLSHITWQVS
ncbi:MAG: phosphatidate cytidylyltransferase [Defluviitaleaceae bacterium]|nr:phosphatidate cytidylyltransferase [Defluviitaleaceae bacterium]